MADQILVPFEGDSYGVGELSWGQRELWCTMRDRNTWLPIGTVTPLPAGTTVDNVAAELRFLMSRYPAMRTRLRHDPDGTRQVAARAGAVPLEVVDAPGDADPARVAEQVRQRYTDTGYDFVNEWPVRMAVIRHHGVPTHRVWVMCHLVTDAAGAAVLLAELADRDPAGRPAAMPPLAQARWQCSPPGQRYCARVLRHWQAQLRGVPARRFPDGAGRPRPRYRIASFTSPALLLAVRAIAGRTGAASSPVLLAVFAVALARVTGIDPVVTRLVVNNRFRPGLARTVSPIVHNGLCVLDVAGSTVDEVVARARRRAFVAYKYAYYDPPRLAELVTGVGRERGEEIDLSCFFNDRRLRPPDPVAGPAPTPDRVREALPDTSFRWDEGQDDRPYDTLFLNVEDVPDTLAISAFVDSHGLPPAGVEACVRGMEAVAVAAAFDPTAPTGVPHRTGAVGR